MAKQVVSLNSVDSRQDRNKYQANPASLQAGISLTLMGVVFLFTAGFIADVLFIQHAVSLYGLKIIGMVLFAFLGAVFLYMGIQVLAKRIFRNRLYLYLHRDFLFERNLNRVTVIPRQNMVHAYERRQYRDRKSDLYFDTIVYRDAEGRERIYDLKDHYFPVGGLREQTGHDNLHAAIRSFFKIGKPDPHRRFGH
jgi:hypothetical protein